MKEKILVVDDEDMVRTSLLALLEEEGYTVEIAETGQEGLEKFRKSTSDGFDVVLVDYKLPDIDGLQVARTIRETNQKVSIVFITAYSSLEPALEAMKLGAFDFLEKPLYKDIVLTTVKKALLSKKFYSTEVEFLEHPRILIVDDDYIVRLGLEETLRSAGYPCKGCSSGLEALKYIEQESYQVVIVDLKLEDMEGTEVIKKIREYFSEMMAIIITGFPSVESAVEAIKSSAFDYIVKPLHGEDVVYRLKTGWEKHKQRILIKQLLTRLQVTNLELEKVNHRLNQLTVTDDLTSLYNHRHLESTLSMEYHRARRFQLPLSFILLDIDHFKVVNDTYGHSAGDAVLAELAGLLKTQLRDIDIAGRYGGEEFCIILPNTELSGAIRAGEKLLKAVAEKPFEVKEGTHCNITISLGISSLSDEGMNSPDDLLGKADNALYEAKLRGRNRLICWKEISGERKAESEKVEDYILRASHVAVLLKDSYLQSVKAMVIALEAKDGYTATHSYLVSYYSVILARHLKLSEEDTDTIKTAALLHDIGKIAIPDNILRKEERLTEEERAIINRHAEAGAKILSPMGFLQRELGVARSHQEHWDGTGYPYGLKGHNIPLGSRILTICDAFEAMTARRPYRKKPLSTQEAFEELRKGAGRQFDPALVEPFITSIKETLATQRELYIKDLDKKVILPEIKEM